MKTPCTMFPQGISRAVDASGNLKEASGSNIVQFEDIQHLQTTAHRSESESESYIWFCGRGISARQVLVREAKTQMQGAYYIETKTSISVPATKVVGCESKVRAKTLVTTWNVER